jgi:hypothetical protein
VANRLDAVNNVPLATAQIEEAASKQKSCESGIICPFIQQEIMEEKLPLMVAHPIKTPTVLTVIEGYSQWFDARRKPNERGF